MTAKYIGIAIVVVVLAGGGLFFAQGQPGVPAVSSEEYGEGKKSEMNTDAPDQPQTENTFSGSLAELAKRGGTYECTFSHTSDVGDSTGVVYVSGERVRGDFKSSAQVAGGFVVESHMIVKEGYTYAWTSLSPQGFKAKATTEGASSATPTSAAYTDQNQSYDYTCVGWRADDSKFELPPITFVDVN